MFKVMTINLWRYHDWDVRLANIIALLTAEAPDVVAFQEVQTNHAYHDVPSSAVIAERCGYSYHVFSPTLARHDARDRSGEHTQLASEGQAFISKLPLLSAESYFLTYRPEYPEEKAVLFATFEVDGRPVRLCNLHLANSDTAYPQLDQVLSLITQRQTPTLLLGDFNIYSLPDYKQVNKLLQDYTVSTEITDYISYPEDNDTLDYIVASTTTLSLSDIQCHTTYVSDHRAVSATVHLLG